MAGVWGFEPQNDGIKTRCLTAWLYPNNVIYFLISIMMIIISRMVRVKRLELSHLAILEPKSSASTNSAKPAQFLYQTFHILLYEMVATPGFEPGTPSLWVMCSNQLSYVAFPSRLSASGAYYANLIELRQPFLSKKYDFLFVCLFAVQFAGYLHKNISK